MAGLDVSLWNLDALLRDWVGIGLGFEKLARVSAQRMTPSR
ncbi:hypothetical protein [Streptomyces scabichelini]|nr:hypothetical protein [Streptomyces scabichelini]